MLVQHGSKQTSMLASDPASASSRVRNSVLSATWPELTAPEGPWAVPGTVQFRDPSDRNQLLPLLLDGLLCKHCATQDWTRKKRKGTFLHVLAGTWPFCTVAGVLETQKWVICCLTFSCSMVNLLLAVCAYEFSSNPFVPKLLLLPTQL